MRATRALRFVSSRVGRDGPSGLVAQASPHLVKQWKSYTFVRNQRIQQLSPFEIDVLGPLFKDVAARVKHKIEDNVWDVAPPLVFFVALVAFVKWKRTQILLSHRD